MRCRTSRERWSPPIPPLSRGSFTIDGTGDTILDMRGWNRSIALEAVSLTASGCRNLLRYNTLALAAARGDSPPQPVASHSFESAAPLDRGSCSDPSHLFVFLS